MTTKSSFTIHETTWRHVLATVRTLTLDIVNVKRMSSERRCSSLSNSARILYRGKTEGLTTVKSVRNGRCHPGLYRGNFATSERRRLAQSRRRLSAATCRRYTKTIPEHCEGKKKIYWETKQILRASSLITLPTPFSRQNP